MITRIIYFIFLGLSMASAYPPAPPTTTFGRVWGHSASAFRMPCLTSFSWPMAGKSAELRTSGGGFELWPDLDKVFDSSERFTELTDKDVNTGNTKTLIPRQRLVATARVLRAKLAEGQTDNVIINDGTILSANIFDGTITDIKLSGQLPATRIVSGAVSNTEF